MSLLSSIIMFVTVLTFYAVLTTTLDITYAESMTGTSGDDKIKTGG